MNPAGYIFFASCYRQVLCVFQQVSVFADSASHISCFFFEQLMSSATNIVFSRNQRQTTRQTTRQTMTEHKSPLSSRVSELLSEDAKQTNFKKTKIVSTLGPASTPPDKLEALITAGVVRVFLLRFAFAALLSDSFFQDVFRLNFSHSSEHSEWLFDVCV